VGIQQALRSVVVLHIKKKEAQLSSIQREVTSEVFVNRLAV